MARITIKVSKGKSAGKVYEYTQKESLIVGRENICHVRFSSEEAELFFREAVGRYFQMKQAYKPKQRHKELAALTFKRYADWDSNFAIWPTI